MKILAVTDIHGEYAAVDRMIRREKPDAVIIGGDLTTNGTTADAERGIRMFLQHGILLFCVAGNMDHPDHDGLYSRLGVSIQSQPGRIGELAVIGVSGAPLSPLHTPYELPEEEILRRARSALAAADRTGGRILIVVPHVPPRDTTLDLIASGCHVGSTAVRKFIEEEQPELVLCGHIHEARGIDTIGRSVIVNCGPAMLGSYAVVDISGDTLIPTLCRLD